MEIERSGSSMLTLEREIRIRSNLMSFNRIQMQFSSQIYFHDFLGLIDELKHR